MTAGEVALLAAAVVVVLLELVILGRLDRLTKLHRAGLHRMAAIMAGVQDLGGATDLPRPTGEPAPELELDDVGNAAARDTRA